MQIKEIGEKLEDLYGVNFITHLTIRDNISHEQACIDILSAIILMMFDAGELPDDLINLEDKL